MNSPPNMGERGRERGDFSARLCCRIYKLINAALTHVAVLYNPRNLTKTDVFWRLPLTEMLSGVKRDCDTVCGGFDIATLHIYTLGALLVVDMLSYARIARIPY